MKKFKSKKIAGAVVLLLCCGLLLQASSSQAKWRPFKKIKEKIEVTGGWDRYIYAWGDRFVPPPDRWVAIRSAQKSGKRDMGNFWDIPGDGKKVEGSFKPLQLWHLKYKFQRYPQSDRRYKFIPAWEVGQKEKSDYGYYYILCKTGYFVSVPGRSKGKQLKLRYAHRNRYYPGTDSYKWKVENVGSNRFILTNKYNAYVVDAAGGKGTKNGTKLITWSRHGGKCQQWEFIYIAQGKEVKSTGKMIKNRSKEIARTTKNVTQKAFNSVKDVINKAVIKGVKKSTAALAKGLMEVKHDQKNKVLLMRVGVDNPLDKLQELKDKTISRFVQIDLKRFEFKVEKNNKLKLSLINRIASMGKHVDLTLSFVGDWKLDKSGFSFRNLRMQRFSIPFFPDSTTSGIRNSESRGLSKIKVNLKKYPGQREVAEVLQLYKNRRLKVEDIERSRTKFLVKLSYR